LAHIKRDEAKQNQIIILKEGNVLPLASACLGGIEIQ
jgi:hypothetical protein